jgi:hypothetical protein
MLPCAVLPPSPVATQNIENKRQEKFALCKVFHLNELDIKIFIRKDLRIRIQAHTKPRWKTAFAKELRISPSGGSSCPHFLLLDKGASLVFSELTTNYWRLAADLSKNASPRPGTGADTIRPTPK